jgi:ABC-type sulfate transport system substrate-binding protein
MSCSCIDGLLLDVCIRAFAKRQYGSDAKAQAFVAKFYKNMPVLDTVARGSSVTFAQRNKAMCSFLGRTRRTCWKRNFETGWLS